MKILLYVILTIDILIYATFFIVQFFVPGANLNFYIINGLLLLLPLIILLLNIKISHKVLTGLSLFVAICLLMLYPAIIFFFGD